MYNAKFSIAGQSIDQFTDEEDDVIVDEEPGTDGPR